MARAFGWRATAGVGASVEITMPTTILARDAPWLRRGMEFSLGSVVEPSPSGQTTIAYARGHVK